MPAPSNTPAQQEIVKPQKPEWTCEITTAPKAAEGFTVGEVFELSCQGSPLTLKEPIKIVLPEQNDYAIVLLQKKELTDTTLKYEATHYRAGTTKFPFLDFVDASGGGFISQPMETKVASVIKQNPPPENIYGGIAPLPMVWPMWIFFAAFVTLLVVIGWIAIFLKKRIQRKNLEKNIRKFLSPMGSYHQFSKDIRQLRSSVLFSDRHEWPAPQVQNYISDLNEHFRMFLLREFTVPATTWSSRETQKEIKRKSKDTYPLFRDPLRKALQELDRARGSFESLKSRDCDQLTQIVVKAVDAIWMNKRKGKSA